MSSIPPIIPLWDTTNTNSVPPTSGHRSAGFITNEIPTSQEINGEFNQIGQWLQYLSDGDLTLHNITVNNATITDLIATGLTLGPLLSVAQTNTQIDNWDPYSGSIAGHLVISMTGTGGGTYITGLVPGGATEGRLVVLTNDCGSQIEFEASSPSSLAANRIVCNAMPTGTFFVMPVNGTMVLRRTSVGGQAQWVLAWSSFIVQTRRTRMISPIEAREFITTTNAFGPFGIAINGTPIIYYPIAVSVGEKLWGFNLKIQKTTSAATTLTMKVVRVDSATNTGVTLFTLTNAANNPGFTQIGVSSSTAEVPTSGHSYYVSIQSSTGTSGDNVFSLEISYDPA